MAEMAAALDQRQAQMTLDVETVAATQRKAVVSYRAAASKILALAPAIFIGRLGWVGMKVTDTALLGHVGTHALAGQRVGICARLSQMPLPIAYRLPRPALLPAKYPKPVFLDD